MMTGRTDTAPRPEENSSSVEEENSDNVKRRCQEASDTKPDQRLHAMDNHYCSSPSTEYSSRDLRRRHFSSLESLMRVASLAALLLVSTFDNAAAFASGGGQKELASLSFCCRVGSSLTQQNINKNLKFGNKLIRELARDDNVRQRPTFSVMRSLGVSFRDIRRHMAPIDDDFIDIQGKDDDDEDEEEDDEDNNSYSKVASSEFDESSSTKVDWGGALGKLRERMGDIKDPRKAGNPSNALFRSMIAEGSPNEAILKFVQEAKPDVVSAMSGAVGSLLGGLSNPAIGVETIIKADGEKLGSLCFQLQMTGYMFRNAEYVLALKDLMNLEVNAELEQYKEAFDELDKDGSGYIELAEIQALLETVYANMEDNASENNIKVPPYEVEAFLNFFDLNRDGKISWDEFKKGLDANAQQRWNKFSSSMERLALQGSTGVHDDDDDDDDEYEELENALEGVADISGTIQVELESGKVIDVDAKDYIQGLKEEAKALRQALREEAGLVGPQQSEGGASPFPGGAMSAAGPPQEGPGAGTIGQYISSLGEQNIKKLTDGISPEVVEAMKLLIDYVLDQGHTKGGGMAGGSKKKRRDPKDEMEIAGSALQQLALWQLVLGYRLREQEATGNWKRLLDQ